MKVVGSAQKRSRHAFLQHGSIPLYEDQSRINDYLLNKTKVQLLPPIGQKVNLGEKAYLKQLLAQTFLESLS